MTDSISASVVPGRTLEHPNERHVFERLSWFQNGRPTSVHTTTFVSKTPSTPEVTLESFVYADGAGQEVLTKVQAEPGPAPRQDTLTGALILDSEAGIQLSGPEAARWVGTGRVVLNNKGEPLKQYEPYFSRVSAYDDEAALVYESPAVTTMGRVGRSGPSIRTVRKIGWSMEHGKSASSTARTRCRALHGP